MSSFEFNQVPPAASSTVVMGALPGHHLSPASQRFKQQLVERYERGNLSLAEVHKILADASFQLLYRSQATTLPTPEQLQELVVRARRANAAVQVTGLLLYSEGQFVQVLEGDLDTVQALYAKICQDPRHLGVAVVSEGLQPRRQFAEWSMDFGFADARELESVLDAIQEPHPGPEVAVSSPQLQALLHSFNIG